MKIKVTENEVKIDNEILNDSEYRIHECEFELPESFNGLVQKAVFTWEEDRPIRMDIVNGKCDIPIEVLHDGILKIGVYAFETVNDKLELRYSPSADTIRVYEGSYVANAQNSEGGTPSEFEQLESKVQSNTNNISSLQNVTSTHTTQIETLQADVNNIKSEQITQNQNIQTNANNIQTNTSDIANIKSEQTTQNENISQNTDDIETINNSLTNYSLITETGSQIALNVNSSNYQMTAILKDKNGNTIYTSNVIDLPIESMIINVTYDSTTKEIVFTLQNGTTLRVSVADLVSGLVSTDELNTILANYYTKSEINTLLSSKANSSDVYTKNETDNLLNGKVDVDAYTQGQTAQDANIEENATNINWLQTLVNQMPTVSGQGTDLSLESVLNYRLMKFLPQGVSSQFSTTGKQLFDKTDYEYLDNANVSSGSVINIENNFALIYINLPSGTYTISNAIGSYQWLISDCSEIPAIGASTSPRQVTTGTSATYTMNSSAYLLIRVAKNTVSITDFVNKLQIEQGSTATSYEPYTGGVPAPNSSYPFPVKSVTGENSLVISNVNLFDSEIESGGFNSSGLNQMTTQRVRNNNYIPCKENTNYALSIFEYNTSKGNAALNINYYDKNDFETPRLSSSGWQDNNYIFTTPQKCKYIRMMFQIDNKIIEVSDISKIMLIEGSTAPTTYVEHEEQIKTLSLGNIELNSSPDGTIRDAIIGTPDNWFKREYIGKVVLNGSEYWSISVTNTSGYNRFTSGVIYNLINKPSSTSQVVDVLSNYFIKKSADNTYQRINGISVGTNGNLYIYDDDFKEYTVEQFKNWLSTHNTTVYYPKVQYTDIPITDTTLINQLNDMYYNAHSYNGVTNITTTYADSNEQMYLDIEALKNVWSDLTTRVEALESEV